MVGLSFSLLHLQKSAESSRMKVLKLNMTIKKKSANKIYTPGYLDLNYFDKIS